MSTNHESTASSGFLPLSKLLVPAMIAVILTYSGWFVTAYIGGEIRTVLGIMLSFYTMGKEELIDTARIMSGLALALM